VQKTPEVAPVPRDAAAEPTSVDLLHAVPARVAVSSTVANGAYSPFDLVDGDLTTAWNSRTGDGKAWIAFRMPPSTHVERVRMTVGFTGKGPEGDYFTMNPRIQKVAIWHDGVQLREVTLDPASRELQDVPVDANGGDYKLVVTATVPGSRKDWREICVSELEVIGRPPPGMKPREDLAIFVGSLDGTPIDDPTIALYPVDTFGSVDAFCAKALADKEQPCEKFELDCRDPAGAPTCGVAGPKDATPALPGTLPAGWKSPRWIIRRAGTHTTEHCHLAFDTADHKVAVLDAIACGPLQDWAGDVSTRPQLALAGGWFTIVDHEAGSHISGDSSFHVTEQLVVCGNNSDGDPVCTLPIPIGGVDHVEQAGGEPGADGLDVHDEVVYRLSYKLAGAVISIDKDSGKPDEEGAKSLGRHRLRY
jgi:hypothetical protein